MQKFKPEADYIGFDQCFKYREFNTYRELKKQIPDMLKKSIRNQVTVLRWKDNWQYFEHWRMEEGKPRIVKQGFM